MLDQDGQIVKFEHVAPKGKVGEAHQDSAESRNAENLDDGTVGGYGSV